MTHIIEDLQALHKIHNTLPEAFHQHNVRIAVVDSGVKKRVVVRRDGELNRHAFCYGQAASNTTVWGTPAFGTVNSQCNIPRRLQLALELFF